jgi:succinate dehydrogenase / fumarate reductase cytochrome b subunit
MTMAERPLSPHLFIYRFAYTMALSISHRITGVAMAVGLLALACWLMAAANGADAYAAVIAAYSHWFFKLLLLGWLLCFLFHFANGIRHLFWDAGLGLEKAQARRSALIVVIVVLLALALCLWQLFGRTAVTP